MDNTQLGVCCSHLSHSIWEGRLAETQRKHFSKHKCELEPLALLISSAVSLVKDVQGDVSPGTIGWAMAAPKGYSEGIKNHSFWLFYKDDSPTNARERPEQSEYVPVENEECDPTTQQQACSACVEECHLPVPGKQQER